MRWNQVQNWYGFLTYTNFVLDPFFPLFYRLAKSKDKEGLMKLVHKGQEVSNAEDAIKDPMVLEFLGLPESHQLTESKLEIALI